MNEIAKVGYGRAENVARLRERDGGRSSFWLGCVADHLANRFEVQVDRDELVQQTRKVPGVVRFHLSCHSPSPSETPVDARRP